MNYRNAYGAFLVLAAAVGLGTVALGGCSRNVGNTNCGNGAIDPGEQCDDGNRVGGDGCSADCTSNELCGNGIVDTIFGEVCDNGDATDGDGCSADCRSDETCGNGIVDTAVGEVCDPGDASAVGCSPDCRSDLSCGNGIVDAGEECDDGNFVDLDGCSSVCLSETCGDGVISTLAGEVCDDGNTVGGDGCAADCRSDETCGNGVVDDAPAPLAEPCDDGDDTNVWDGCNSCTIVEYLVSPDSGQEQSVALAPDGTVILVWTRQTATYRVVVELIHPDGSRGPEVLLPASVPSDWEAERPKVAVAADGSFGVAFSTNTVGGGGAINYQRFDAAGAAVGSPVELHANARPPYLAMAGDGAAIVTWNDGGDTYRARLDSAGAIASPAQVALAGVAGGPVGLADNGNYVLAWVAGTFGARDTTAALFDSSDGTIRSAFVVPSSAAPDETYCDVAMAASGTFVVAWRETGPVALRARRFDASGTALAAQFNPNDAALGGSPLYVHVNSAPGGAFIIGWDGTGADVARFDSSGVRQGTDIVASHPLSDGERTINPAINDAGRYVVAWDNILGVLFQRFNVADEKRGILPY